MMKIIALTAALGLALHQPTKAQNCPHGTEDAEIELSSLLPTFYSADSADAASRGSEIQRLSESDSAYVVRDERECGRVLSRAVRYMREHDPTWKAGQEGNYEANVFRLGSYYVVGIAAESAPATHENGVLNFDSDVRGKYIVMRERGLKVVRVFGGTS
jgi:hypothetical protein